MPSAQRQEILIINPSFLASSVALCLCPILAHASGQLPPMPIEDRILPSLADCRAFLDTTWRADQAKADPRPRPDKDGTKQTLVYSKGVVVIDDSHVSYEVEEGWQFRRPVLEHRQIRTDYSYERRSYQCDGNHLTGTSTSGYALEGYQAMPEGAGAVEAPKTGS